MAHFQPLYKFSFDSFEEVVSMLSGMQTPHCSYLVSSLQRYVEDAYLSVVMQIMSDFYHEILKHSDTFSDIFHQQLEALVDRHMCEYERILSSDPLLTCHCSLPSILAILNSLVFLLRLLFLNDGLQWIVFNGTRTQHFAHCALNTFQRCS